MAYQFPPDLEQRVKEQMASGVYNSEDEVLRDALRALEEIGYFRPLRREGRISFEELREEVSRGLDQLDRGEGRNSEQVFADLLHDLPDPDNA